MLYISALLHRTSRYGFSYNDWSDTKKYRSQDNL